MFEYRKGFEAGIEAGRAEALAEVVVAMEQGTSSQLRHAPEDTVAILDDILWESRGVSQSREEVLSNAVRLAKQLVARGIILTRIGGSK